MPRKSKDKPQSEMDLIMDGFETRWASEVERRDEKRKDYEQLRATISGLAPLDRAAAWLAYVAEHRECDGDLESITFLASRGRNIDNLVQKVIGEWKEAEKKRIADYNKELQQRGGSRVTVNDVATTLLGFLPNFWRGRGDQRHSIDATMLRAVEWCRVGGFEHWWERLAQDAIEDMMLGGSFEDVSRAFWLFAMCRSDYAVKLMPKALHRALDGVGGRRGGGGLPWQTVDLEEVPGKITIRDSIPWASAVVFAEHRLHYESGFKDQAIAAIMRHQEDGSWRWRHDEGPSIEATAMAMHALGMARPMGWELAMAGARSWLMKEQHEDGYWDEPGASDHVFITVLVLDALSLASQPSGPLTFGWQATTTFAQGDQAKPQGPRVPATAAELTWDRTAEERKAAVDAYIQEVWERTNKKITRKSIWLKARYESPTEFERWQRKDPRTTRNVHERFVRILIEKPHLKLKE